MQIQSCCFANIDFFPVLVAVAVALATCCHDPDIFTTMVN